MAKPVDEDPFVQMDRWGVLRDRFGLRLVGREITTNAARISSPVVSWDANSQTATTLSGRFYELVGAPHPVVTANVARARVNRWRLRPEEVSLVEPGDLENLLALQTKEAREMEAIWQGFEGCVGSAAFHFGKVATVVDAVSGDEYVANMAIRHAIQCGAREFVDALQRLQPKGSGFSLLDTRKAYLAIRALEYEELVSPSDIDAVTLVEAVAAARVMAEFLPDDFQRIRKEIGDA